MLELSTRKKFKMTTPSEATPIPIDATSVECWVLDNLGKPPNYSRTIAKRITPTTFRVNVYITDRMGFALSDSFFVTYVDDQFASSPAIVRKHQGV